MRTKKRGRVRVITVGVAVTLVGALGASVASAAPPSGVSMQGTGPQPKGLGLFSRAALAQEHCTENGRMRFNLEGNGPFCVNPWPEGKDNGDATAPGVTGTEVKVVVYLPPRSVVSSSGQDAPKNRATGASATAEEAIADRAAMYDYAIDQYGSYQLWGRAPVFEVVYASGTDEASQRADALDVANHEPFMVMDLVDATTGAAVFAAELANRKIVIASASTKAEIAEQQSPYRWNFGADPTPGIPLTASFIGKSLDGKKATWAGDRALTSKTRTFGVVHPDTDFDMDEFERALTDAGGSVAEELEFDTTASDLDQAVGTFISRLKAAGITSVVLFTDPGMMSLVMRAATTQDYFPEWIITGWGYTDWDGFGRSGDAEQMKHAFGVAQLWPELDSTRPADDAFNWYWGEDNGTTWGAGIGLAWVYMALHYAGPNLTAQNLKKGLFAMPASGGYVDGLPLAAVGYGRTVGLPYDQYASFGADRTLIWWDPHNTEPSGADSLFPGTPGQYVNLYNGKRFGLNGFPKSPKFFDEAASVATLAPEDQYTAGKVPPVSPCPGCPSERDAA